VIFVDYGNDGQYYQRQKEYTFELIDEYSVRATARILKIPRRTLLRWCRRQGKYVVVAHGTANEVANAKKIIEGTKAIESGVHHTEPVKV
jgi:hypothetical protein